MATPMSANVLPLFADVSAAADVNRPELIERSSSGEIIVGDARRVLTDFPEGHFRTIVTSPPYWGLRDYGIEGQIGAEMDLDAYIRDLVALFRECRRVLADDGTFWLNVGDSFTSGGRTWRQTDSKNAARGMDYRAPTPPGLKPKDLIGVPWRLAFALQADGWYLRTDIVWHKPNGQPESVKDRPTRVHEFVFLFTKSERYFYDWEATKEPVERNGKYGSAPRSNPDGKRALRSVWSINTEPTKDTNFAVFPPSLVRPCITAGSEPGDRVLDPFMGSGTTGIVALELARDFVGVELSPDIAEVARKRIWTTSRYAVRVRPAS